MLTKEKDQKIDTAKVLQDFKAQIVEHTVGEPGTKRVTFATYKEGVIEIRRTHIGTFARLQTKLSDKFSLSDIKKNPSLQQLLNVDMRTLPSASSIPKFQLALPKIPLGFLSKIIRFFRAVHDKQGTEAAALIRWSLSKKEYYIEIPGGPKGEKYQDLSAGGVKYEPARDNKDPIAMDIHSHHTMPPFFSSTDDNDEKWTQLYAVVGHIDNSQASVNIRARMHREDLISLRVDDIFDTGASFDKSWMDMIKEPPKDLDLPPYMRDWDDKYHNRGSLHRKEWWKRPDWEKHVDKLRGKDSTPEATGDTPPDPSEMHPFPASSDEQATQEFERLKEDIWASLENELYDSPETFHSQEAITELRKYLMEMLSTVSADEILQHHLADKGEV